MPAMARSTKTKSCFRCQSLDNVKTVNYVRAERQLTEPWCEPCRRSKLVKGGSAGGAHRPTGVRTALLIVAIAGLGAVLMLVLAFVAS